ncbi:hypothetical protein BDV25DRAFT_54612 [Aspergillus avenaceus]|uniref:Uncharacterized protein n=1 Tax=Aspergillus avenaceus TaxID=36643 RepID=A0A5N6TIP7_ASPAV|nr:hypothetical protein BDV25DRAFT_54612 [Aspergillus avenaceus]
MTAPGEFLRTISQLLRVYCRPMHQFDWIDHALHRTHLSFVSVYNWLAFVPIKGFGRLNGLIYFFPFKSTMAPGRRAGVDPILSLFFCCYLLFISCFQIPYADRYRSP